MVPVELNITTSYQQVEGETQTVFVISPYFDYNEEIGGDPVYFYSRNYEITTKMTYPDGEEITNTQSMWDWNRGNKTLTKIAIPVDGELMGYYVK